MTADATTAAPRWIVRAASVAIVASLALAVAKLLATGWLALLYPYDLDYGEGIVWQQMRDIVGGRGYAPLGVYPAIVYHYPPVYHLTTALVAGLGGVDQLLAGRLVSLASTIASMLLVGRLIVAATGAREHRAVAYAAAAVGGACLACVPAILTWGVLMRVDLLGCALTLAGLALAIRAIERPAAVPVAALVFVLAIYTKQTSIVGPIAAIAGLWFVRRRSAVALAGWSAGLGLVALGWLEIESRGGFLRHVLLYNINRLDLSRWRLLAFDFSAQAPLIVVAAVATAATAASLYRDRARLRDASDPSDAASLILLLFLAIKTAMLPTILKSGASDNYLIEWYCALAVFVGLAVVPLFRAALGSGAPVPLALTALFGIALPLQAWRAPAVDTDAGAIRARAARMAVIVARIRAADRPVISDDMALLIRSGQPVRYEPAIAAELAHRGVYDEAAFVALVRRGTFAFFLTRGDRGSPIYDERYNPATAAAIDAAYPRKETVGGLVFHLPR